MILRLLLISARRLLSLAFERSSIQIGVHGIELIADLLLAILEFNRSVVILVGILSRLVQLVEILTADCLIVVLDNERRGGGGAAGWSLLRV